jgi:hypothetical protein
VYYEGYLGEDFEPYLLSMAELGTWGDELTLVRGQGDGGGADSIA